MIVLQALYLALPIYFANMAPVLVQWVPFLDVPIDAGKLEASIQRYLQENDETAGDERDSETKPGSQ